MDITTTERTEAERHALVHATGAREWQVMVKTDPTGEVVVKSIRVAPNRVAAAEAAGWVLA